MIVQVPEEVQPYVNLFNSMNIGKETEAVIPQSQEVMGDEIGSVIGLGDTLEEAIQECKDHAEKIQGMSLTVKTESLESLLPAIKEAQEKGIKFSDQPIPELK